MDKKIMMEDSVKVIEQIQEIKELNEQIKELQKQLVAFKKFYTGWINHKTQLGIKE
jgi:hypothetical protein